MLGLLGSISRAAPHIWLQCDSGKEGYPPPYCGLMNLANGVAEVQEVQSSSIADDLADCRGKRSDARQHKHHKRECAL
ncbi:hypothetical protein SKAU_G00126410 [Synaphobranchus kaupii]|uniref:Uncharacterized protein n=1 Tax=Synaphobranchus kaupii TaxID=118154 RepID=A0A9Q1FQ77_SYNKA|nr:hypothetical protein SKAU_G00126410 [Synaphobranchus kaupii]